MSEEAEVVEPIVDPAIVPAAGIILDPAAPVLADGEFFLSDGVKGTGDKPEWYDGERYKSVSEQAKGYKELEKKFGSFTGAPKDGYDIPDDVETDDALFQSLVDYAEEAGMSQDGFNKAWELLETQSGVSVEVNREAEMTALGETATERVKTVETFLKNNLDAESYDNLKGAVNTALVVELVEKLIGATAPPKLPIDGGVHPKGLTMADINVEMFKKNESGDLLRSVDREHEAKIQRMLKEFAGDGEYNETIG